MAIESLTIPIEPLGNEFKDASLRLCTIGTSSSPDFSYLFQIDSDEAQKYGESKYQVIEGARYEYELSHVDLKFEVDGYWNAATDVFSPSRFKNRTHCGIFTPGLSTGTIKLNVKDFNDNLIGYFSIEVRSRKLGYRSDYQQMLTEISQECFDLIQDWQSVSTFKAVPEASSDPQNLAQQFAFIRSLVASESFDQALYQIAINPHEKWISKDIYTPISKGYKSSARLQRQLACSGLRTDIPASHPLRGIIPSLPSNINSSSSIQTYDTPENRFIKFSLTGFIQFLEEIRSKVEKNQSKFSRLLIELDQISKKISDFLSKEIFLNCSNISTLPLNSPTLQRRPGYREILQAWMNFSIAAKLTWNGGDNIYGLGQRNVANLYEYWVFFALLKICKSTFNIQPLDIKNLVQASADGFSLMLKSGSYQAISSSFESCGRRLHFKFSYNRSFRRNSDHRKSGSWTQAMRPDYTISLWPFGFSEDEAEAQELMVHVHFDAKYRLDQITDLLWTNESESQTELTDQALDDIKETEERGTYKRADLLKMHAYRDAIRRSHGAYVIYPGNSNEGKPFQTFHEILPGLGAFALRPGAGTETLEQFLRDVVRHVSDRTTARERQSFQTYKSYLNKPPEVAEEQRAAYRLLPEELSGQRHPPPVDTHVLVGWYKSQAHLDWIQSKGKYNFRLGPTEGGLRLSPQVVGAHYLLLYGGIDGHARNGLYRIKSSQQGPEFMNKAGLQSLGYPTLPTRDSYAVFDVEIAQEFAEFEWKLTKLKQFPDSEKLGHPFATTLADLFGTLGPDSSNS